MKKAYPIILTPCEEGGYSVFVPDFEVNTQGEDVAEAIDMACDAIGMCGVYDQDKGRPVPAPSATLPAGEPGDIVTYAVVDFDAYRQEVDTKAERVSVTVPRNLRVKAKAAGLNLSQELQARLREVLSAT